MRYSVYAQYKDGSKNGYYVEGYCMSENEFSKQWMENRAYEWSSYWTDIRYEVREIQDCVAESQEAK